MPESGRASRRRAPGARGDLGWLVALLVVGMLAGVGWRLLVGPVVAASDRLETAVAGDATLALLGAVAGVLTALVLLARPGPAASRRVLVVLLGCCTAGALCWQTGALLGAPPLRASATAFVWPLTTAAVIFVVTGLRLVTARN